MDTREQTYILDEDTRIRQEGDRYLLVNISTQGLHFISPTAYKLVTRLDGKSTVGQVVQDLYLGALFEEGVDQVGADESCSAGDEGVVNWSQIVESLNRQVVRSLHRKIEKP